MGSISSFIGQPALVPYNTTKGSIIQMTQCLAYDLAKDNIRVNCVCPGTIETPASLSHANSLGLTREQFIEEVKTQQFIPRIGEPIEVAYAVLFLASDEASYITGSSLMVDGGYTAR
ncbi:MAG: SDR family NAD(P)-dependent oxidoreductase [Crocosphaera sp.]